MSFNLFSFLFLYRSNLQEGITLTIKSFSHLRKELSLASFTEFTDESKADKLLGGGRGSSLLSFNLFGIIFYTNIA